MTSIVGLLQASRLVETLYTQMTEGDSPTVNDQPSVHVTNNTSPVSTTTSQSMDSDEPPPGEILHSQKLGHVALARQCSQALEVISNSKQTLRATHSKHNKKPKPISTNTANPKLQQFGSEYARHLSTSQLAPNHEHHHKKHQHPKRRTMAPTPSKPYHLDTASDDIQTGALLDIIVTTRPDELPPSGYYRIPQPTCSSKLYYLNVKKEPSWDKAAQRPCITAITVLFPNRNEAVPPGFSLVKVHKANIPADFGTPKERIFLCIRRSREGNPITNIKWIAPPDFIPDGYTVVEKSPRNHVANLCGQHFFIAYRQRLASLEALRPSVLLDTLTQKPLELPNAHAETAKKSNSHRCRLVDYYTTGGTTVRSESLGRFHILDRSTHSLLSPSAIGNRLHIIECSRRRSESAGSSSSFLQTGSTIYARSDMDGDDDEQSSYHKADDRKSEAPVVMTSVDELGQLIMEDDCQLSDHGNHHDTNANLSSLLVGAHEDSDAVEAHDDQDAMCDRAMAFIPKISTFRQDSSLQRRIALMTPILTACYTRHGGVAWAAVNGLTELLKETDFFTPDFAESPETTVCVTLLDLAIQAVCDVATSGTQESHFASCVEFVETAVRYSKGYLGARTAGFVVRFYLFVFYFDASIAAPNGAWPLTSWRPNSMKDEEDFPFLFEPDERKTYLSGGAAQSAVLALKELVSLTVMRLARVKCNDSKDQTKSNQPANSDSNFNYKSYFGDIISESIDKAVDSVERCRLTQLAIHQIHRSGGSELFWHEMVHACGRELFSGEGLSTGGIEVYGIFFALLETIVKTASGKIRSTGSSTLLPKDIASKLLSLELLLHTLEAWNDEQDAAIEPYHQTAISSLGYVIRRTVAPCLLWNTKASLGNSQVFRRLIRVLSELWCSGFYRSHCKLELALLIEQFALYIVELGPQCFEDVDSGNPHLSETSLLTQQNEVILEIKNWFTNDPHDAVDLFLNYDTELTGKGSGPIALTPGKRSRIFQRLCSGLGRIAERCDEIIGEQIRSNQTMVMTRRPVENERRSDKGKLRIEAARLLRKSSLDALSQIVKAVTISAGSVVGEEYAALFSSWCLDYESSSLRINLVPNQGNTNNVNDLIVGFWNSAIVQDKIRKSTAAVPTKKESIQKSFTIAKEKSVKKAVEFLTACNVLKSSPREIASFLFAHKERFNQADLGVFLSESGTGGQELEHWKLVRYLYIRSISFIGLQVDEALRHFLNACGFRLPEEAQKIDRILCSFAQCFFEDNAGDAGCCPFKDEDTVYLIVFAIIMLNTDLHKAENSKSKRRQQKKMTKADFTNNLKNAVQNEGIPKQYLGRIYDAILTKPISLLECDVGPQQSKSSTNVTVEHIVTNVQKADALLRSSAVHEYPFLSIVDLVENLKVCGDDAATDITRSCVSRTWHYWYGAVNSCLSTAHLDPHGLVPAIDVLIYGLSASVCLEMPMERSAFLWQVVRLKSFDDRRHGNFLDDNAARSREEKWFAELDKACTGMMETKLTVLRKIFDWGNTLKIRLQRDVKARMEMTVAVQELANADFLLQDPARSFLQSGNLMKISCRTGRTVEYRFYLFSDVLLYASKDGEHNKYRIHEDLPLHLMKIVDWFPLKQKNRNLMFAVHHPRKTFHVLCPNVTSRKAWVEDIRAAIMVEMERKMANEAARISAANAGKR